MTSSRYVVFDDAPKSSMVDFDADQFADALRAPLAAIGVRVVRQRGARSNSPIAGFQARGLPRWKYQDKLKAVETIVRQIYLGRTGGVGSGAVQAGIIL